MATRGRRPGPTHEEWCAEPATHTSAPHSKRATLQVRVPVRLFFPLCGGPFGCLPNRPAACQADLGRPDCITSSIPRVQRRPRLEGAIDGSFMRGKPFFRQQSSRSGSFFGHLRTPCPGWPPAYLAGRPHCCLAAGLADPANFPGTCRGNHLSSTTCLTHYLFKSDE